MDVKGITVNSLETYLAELGKLEPSRPLTATEERVVRVIARGRGYKGAALILRMRPRTVQAHVISIANRLPNPENLAAKELVTVWWISVTWLKMQIAKEKIVTAA
jgi:DNA-binding CsgD family transcriptional regulator